MHVIAAKAVCFKEALMPEFVQYQKNVVENAAALAEALIKDGLRLVSGGTDNHLMLVDVRPKGITGRIAQDNLALVNITANKNTIPFDPESPMVTSGIRLGTPAISSRGLKPADMEQLGRAIAIALEYKGEASKLDEARGIVNSLCAKYPLYSG